MIQLIPSEQRHTTDHGWLLSKFSFSFADYYDPSNRNFGALRVFNDDVIQPGKGFGMHPHADMEIMTYVIEGTVEHQDSLGNRGLIEAGEIQRMTAGTGIYHSEYNGSKTDPVHLLQLWFLPKHKALEPSWEQKRFTKEQQLNTLLPVVSGQPAGEALSIHQDLTVFMSTLEAGRTLTHRQADQRRMYVFVISGKLTLSDGTAMSAGDSARITHETELTVTADETAEFMLIDMY